MYFLFIFLVFFVSPVYAINTGTAQFLGNLTSSCDVSNFIDGTIVANSGATSLSSTAAGGTPATFTAQTNAGSYKITLGTPTLVGPSGTVTGVTFTTTASATGTGVLGSIISLINSVAGVLNLSLGGTYAVTVNATATLPSGSFEAGTYTLSVPVSCSL